MSSTTNISTTTEPSVDSPRIRPSTSTALAPLAALIAVAVLPFLISDSGLGTLSYSAVYAIAAMGLTVVVGQTGQVSLAQPFFIGIGAYVAAYGSVEFGLPLAAAVVIALVIGAALGWAVGWMAIRIGGVELAIVTLGLVFLGDYIFHEWWSVTGGEGGLAVGELSLSVFGYDLEESTGFTRAQIMFWALWIVVAIVAWAVHRVLSQRPGRALVAVRENPKAAEAIGVDVRFYKTGAFAIASALGALAGVLFALLQQYVTPADFDLEIALLLIAMIVLGGQDRISGAIVGAIVVYGGSHWLAEQVDNPLLAPILKSSDSDAGFISSGSFSTLVLGVLIVVVLCLRPSGIVGAVTEVVGAVRRKRATSGTSGNEQPNDDAGLPRIPSEEEVAR